MGGGRRGLRDVLLERVQADFGPRMGERVRAGEFIARDAGGGRVGMIRRDPIPAMLGARSIDDRMAAAAMTFRDRWSRLHESGGCAWEPRVDGGRGPMGCAPTTLRRAVVTDDLAAVPEAARGVVVHAAGWALPLAMLAGGVERRRLDLRDLLVVGLRALADRYDGRGWRA